MAEPKKETARIAFPQKPETIVRRPPPILPSQAASPPVLHRLPKPNGVPPPPAIVATSKTIDAFDSIPRWFCWGLLGLSSLIFFIQIWNYALS
jgi:hypothetical protein